MYHVYKLIHILAVVLFLGNIITGLFWKMHADGSKDLRIIAHTLAGIIRSDRWFTIPGVIVITTAGILGAIQGGLPLLRTGWILWSLILFTLSGLAFAFFVAPLQRVLADMTRIGANGGEFDWDRYRAKSRAWEWWGLFATLAPLIAVGLMVLKPNL
ncbi:MAG TPA: DUF2269 family protein [Thermoanaerobaculia bacterium]|nr:DUF2269 family protein [Thermoanaerobaculia bacterium]